jgi:endonuclease/exonuclease/phosphatase (EEP) superfamily protein YafD
MELDFRSIARRLTYVGLFGLGFGCVLSLCGRLWWVFELASHFMMQYLFGAIVLLLVFLLLRLWRGAAVTAGLLIFVGVQTVPFLFAASEKVPEGIAYRMIAMNLLRSNEQVDDVLNFIEKESPDILLLQEVTPRWVRHLGKPLEVMYPHRILQERDHAFGIWLLSKYPWREAEMLPSPHENVPFVTAEIDLDGVPLHFVGVHPLPPVGQSMARERDARLAEAGTLIGGKTGVRLLAGDLNCTPWSPYFRKLLRDGRLKNSGQWQKCPPTWYSGISWLGLPIDHCLVSDGITVTRREVGPDVGSDHRPLVVEFKLIP